MAGIFSGRRIIYRNYSDEAIGRLKLIKKFQGIGCSLAELKTILQEQDSSARTNQEVISWILQKIHEIERKKDEYDHMLVTQLSQSENEPNSLV